MRVLKNKAFNRKKRHRIRKKQNVLSLDNGMTDAQASCTAIASIAVIAGNEMATKSVYNSMSSWMRRSSQMLSADSVKCLGEDSLSLLLFLIEFFF